MTPRERMRVVRRTAACAQSTLSFWGRFEAARQLSSDRPEHLRARWVTRWARDILSIFDLDVRANGPFVGTGNAYPGADAHGIGRIFVLNHRSGMDIPITFAYTHGRLVSRHDLASWPVIGLGAQRIGTLFVDRASLRSGATVLKQMTRALQRGEAVAIYPEGTAFSGDEVRPFRPGAFRAAQKAGAEIIPIGLAYADERAYFGDEDFLPHLERVASLPQLSVAIEVGQAIPPGERTLTELRDVVHQAVQECVHRARARL